MIPFNYHHLYYFYTIAQSGSVSKAAKELHLSQPALSFQLKQLETCLNVKLFERNGRQLVLTEEGHSALSYAKQIFDTGKEFIDRLKDFSQKGRTRIQIGVLNSIPKSFTNCLLKFILRAKPDIHIELKEDTLERMIENLKDHFLDLILADTPFQSPVEEAIQNHLIAKIPIVFCSHPALAKKYKKIPMDLNDAPMILPTSDSKIYQLVQEYLVAYKVTPRIIAEVQDIELAYLMAIDKMGVVPLSALMISRAAAKKVSILPQDSRHEIYETIYLIYKKRKNPHPLLDTIISGFDLKEIQTQTTL